MAHNSYTYVVLPIEELNNVNYSEVLTTSADTVRKNLAETHFIVKYDGAEPSSISAMATKTNYDHESILTEVALTTWTDPNQI